ncbi:single-stranded DNA-binding protein [Pasteurella canis]|uniref:Single-stranded DNA-binding protein n=1 Tax=Pasteurella canis TaxID=753 RepID=A0A379ERM8_9PAST|nr:single-stranded DNA-binding protein [Pasteurella canis]
MYVEGRLRTRKWQDQNGQDRYTTEIQGDVLQMLDSRNDRPQAGGYAPQASAPQYNSPTSGSYGNNFSSQSNRPQQSAPQSEPPMDMGFEEDNIPF